VLGRLVSVVAIFALVHRKEDYRLAAAVQSSAVLIAGLLAWPVISRTLKLHLRWPGVAALRSALLDGWHVFLSTVAINVYTSSTVFFLGLLTNPTTVGYFAAAQKLVKAVQGLTGPISQAVYPHVGALTARSRPAALAFISRLLRWQGIATLFVSLLLFLSAAALVRLLFGPQFGASVRPLEWMAALPFVIGLSNVFGVQTMFNFDMTSSVSRILILCSLVHIALLLPLVHWFGVDGAAASVLLTEIAVTGLMGVALMRRGLLRAIVRMPAGGA